MGFCEDTLKHRSIVGSGWDTARTGSFEEGQGHGSIHLTLSLAVAPAKPFHSLRMVREKMGALLISGGKDLEMFGSSRKK